MNQRKSWRISKHYRDLFSTYFLSIVLFHETVTFSLCSYLFALSILECVTLSHKIRLELLISFLKGRKETFCMKSNKSVSLLLNFVLNQTFISFQFFHWLVPITDINFTSPGNVWLWWFDQSARLFLWYFIEAYSLFYSIQLPWH